MRCTKPVGDRMGGWEPCNEDALLTHTCYDHAKVCLNFPCWEPREWDQPFCPEHMKHREKVTHEASMD